MMKIKVDHNVTVAAMDAFYKLIHSVLPAGNCSPTSSHVSRKVVGALGLEYKVIDTCVNHHVLYRGSLEDVDRCPKCAEPRFHPNTTIPRQVMRYFPLTTRLQLVYSNPILSQLCRWHAESTTAGLMTGPASGEAWAKIKELYPAKFTDPRSLYLGLVMDGVSPFGSSGHSTPYSIWPILIAIYNLPPWLATKGGYSMLVMILPGPKQIPHEFLDVYLQPLVAELLQLWNGVPAIDACALQGERAEFTLYGLLIWTMHDWPGAHFCSGLSTSGLHGCPMCHDGIHSVYDRGLSKCIYGRHRRFLSRGDPMRDDTDHWFNAPDHDEAPLWPDGNDWLARWEQVENGLIQVERSGMRRLSIWWKLPYWKHLQVRHLMDPMHIEANVAKLILQTILGTHSKDTAKVRQACQEYGVHPTAWLNSDTDVLPQAPWMLTTSERRIFMRRLASMEFPTGYGAGFSKSFSGDQPKGLKSHDAHCLMQHGFACAIRGLGSPSLRKAIYSISSVFRKICSKCIAVDHLESLEEEMARAVCLMEKAFPPSFFVSQVHLLVHLVPEIRMCGPFPPRWMYPWERTMGRLKQYCRNRSKPEASMAEGSLMNEVMFHCSAYLACTDIDVRHTWDEVHYRETSVVVQGVGQKYKFRNERERHQAHKYILKSAPMLQGWRVEYEEGCSERMDARRAWRSQNPRVPFPQDLQELPPFDEWFVGAVRARGANVDNQVKSFALGLSPTGLCYKHMYACGSHFRTREYDQTLRSTCDSIVLATFEQQSVASSVDTHPTGDVLDYVGHITDILTLRYGTGVEVTLMRVEWYRAIVEEDLARGIRSTPHNAIRARDESGFKVIDTRRLVPFYEEPFVVAEKVMQAVLCPIDDDPGWSIVVPTPSRFSYVGDILGEESNYDEDLAVGE